MALRYVAALVMGRRYETLAARRCSLQAGYKQEIRRGGEAWKDVEWTRGCIGPVREQKCHLRSIQHVTLRAGLLWSKSCYHPAAVWLLWSQTLRKPYGVSGEQVENTGSCPIGKCTKKCEEQKWRQMLAASPYSKASCARQDRGPLMALWGSLHAVPVTSTAFVADG